MLVSRLTQLTRLLRAAAKSSGARSGLTLARARIVALLSTAPGMTQVEIAERLGISQVQVSRLLRRTLRRVQDKIDPEGLMSK